MIIAELNRFNSDSCGDRLTGRQNEAPSCMPSHVRGWFVNLWRGETRGVVLGFLDLIQNT
jgi:hypothetical protein